MQAQLWSLSGLSVELGRDRRALAKALEKLKPDEESHDKGGRSNRKYRLARVVAHLYAGGAEDGGMGLDEQRARLAAAQAEKVETENAVRRGELAELPDVEAYVVNCFANARAKARALANKLSPRLTNIADANVIAATIRAEVDAMLTELADYEPGAGGSRGADPAGVGDLEAAAGSDGFAVGGSRASTVGRVGR